MSILRYVILVIALLFWGSGLSTTVSRWLYSVGVIKDDYRYGDLYRFTALSQFKEPQPVCPPSNRSSDSASTHLYLIGDSFSEPQRLSQSDFRVSRYQRVTWDEQQRVQLDTTKRNVLVLESIERHVREHFANPVRQYVVGPAPTQQAASPRFYQRILQDFHWSDVEGRLESALFSLDWAFWFKELKAYINLAWFNRANEGASLSRNQQHVFLNSDTNPDKPLNSSFVPVPAQQVDVLVDSANSVASRYKQLGFDAVYLVIIPNKATILEKDRNDYNHLIDLIESNPRLTVPTIDIYRAFKQSPVSPYLKSDTHWNCQGRAIWLDLVRQKVGV